MLLLHHVFWLNAYILTLIIKIILITVNHLIYFRNFSIRGQLLKCKEEGMIWETPTL